MATRKERAARSIPLVLAVLALFVLSGAFSPAVWSNSAGNSATSPTGTPWAASSNSSLAWITPQLLEGLALGAGGPSLANQEAQIPFAFWQALAHQLNPSEAAPSKFTLEGFPSGSSLGGLGILGAGVAVGVTCAVAAAVSAGLACFGLLAAIAIGAVAVYIFNQFSQSQPPGIAWQSVASNMVLATYQRYAQQADDLGQLESALNLTQNALAYEAAASALSQLSNSTFSGPLDLAQSGVAQQLQFTVFQDEFELGQAYWQLLQEGNLVMGQQNGAGTYCYLQETGGSLQGGADEFTAPGSTGTGVAAGACPLTGTAGSYDYGQLYPALTYQAGAIATITSCPPVFLQQGEEFTAYSGTAGTNGVAFIPTDNVAATPIVLNWTGKISVTSSNATFSGATQGYYVCSGSSTNTIDFLPTLSFPLNSATASGTGGPEFVQLSSSASGSEKTNDASLVGEQICAGSSTSCAGFLGDVAGSIGTHHQRGEQTTMVADLWNLANFAENTGQAYWGFLRGLGYTSISQIPSNCIIPTPNVALPPNLSPGALTGITNATQIEDAYETFLAELAKDFNASTTLTSFNFCGTHVTLNFGNTPFLSGTYALGYIYVPGAKNASDASTPQVFGTPSTWNKSGFIYINPNAAPITIPLNTTWLLPNASANTVVLFAQPFTNGSQTAPTLNRLGPTQCWMKRPYVANGCNSTAQLLWLSGVTAGNSTSANKNGTAYPASAGTAKGYSVYLTFCVQPAPGSTIFNPVFVVHPITCTFNYATIIADTTNSNGNNSGIVTPPGSCGQTFPLWSTIVTAWSSVVGSSALGCLIAEGLAVLTLIVLLVVVVYAVAWVADRRE